MTLEQCISAAKTIDSEILSRSGLYAERSDDGLGYAHLRWMVEQIAAGMSVNKAMRWLGYIQGVLVCRGVSTLDEMKKISMNAVKEPADLATQEIGMFDFVEPHDGPVVAGLEKFETVYAKDQPQYRPLRTLPGNNGNSAIARFHFTDEQRKAIAEGADIYLELLHFRGPLAPSLIMVMSEPADTDEFRSWWKAQTGGPYQLGDASQRGEG